MTAKAASIELQTEVLKTRTESIERSVLDMKNSVNQISEAVRQLQIGQSAHNATITATVDGLKKDMDRLIEKTSKK